jgi:hypothetical protein
MDADTAVAPACAAKVAALAAEIYAKPQICSAVVRLDWASYAPGQWQLACGPALDVSETMAKATAVATFDATGLQPGALPGMAKNPPNPEDVFVFTVAPADFGSLSVVSARTGLPLLGAKLNWSGPAKLTYPTSWRDPTLLGDSCKSTLAQPPHQAYDFAGDSVDPTAADIDKALTAVADTALFAAFATQGKLLDIVLIRLQRTVDGSSQATSTSEWVAIVDGGIGK